MTDAAKIEKLTRAINLLLPHAVSWMENREEAARDRSNLVLGAELVKRQVEEAKAILKEVEV